MKEHRRCLILYTTATCNLNCTYCFIDKNPALVKIDNWLDESFMQTPDYYFNLAKEMFIRENLEEMQMWGGEPFLAMHRAYHTVDECIKYFPNLKTFMASTNMVSPQFSDEFWGLIDVLGKHSDRQFTFRLQLSCDGPTEFTDVNRGEGVSEKIREVFHKLVQDVQTKLPNNVTLAAHMKPTLDIRAIGMLQTEEAVYNYFHFFENYYQYYLDNNKKSNFKFSLPIPNTAVPSPHTKEDGIKFANYCRITRKLEKEKRFKHYKVCTSFVRKRKSADSLPLSLSGQCGGHCGNGRASIGLLPNNMISCCHNGFVDMLSEYKKNVMANNSEHLDTTVIEKGLFTNQHNSLIFDKDSREFEMYQRELEEFYDKNSTAKVTNLASLILLCARNGQVEEKYKNKEEAIRGAYFILMHTAYCVRDNLGTSGSIYMPPIGFVRLLLNGAREYIEEDCENGNVSARK